MKINRQLYLHHKGENRFEELFSCGTQVETGHALCSEILKHSPKISEMNHFNIEKRKIKQLKLIDI